MRNRAIVLLMVSVFLIVTSCVTIPEEHKGAAKGAGVGAAAGAVLGAVVGGDTKSAVIGGLLGALVGGQVGAVGVEGLDHPVDRLVDELFLLDLLDVVLFDDVEDLVEYLEALVGGGVDGRHPAVAVGAEEHQQGCQKAEGREESALGTFH